MSGRFYFLKTADNQMYVLRFTGERDKLKSIRNQTDSIARTFKVKAVCSAWKGFQIQKAARYVVRLFFVYLMRAV
jgi:hypothetical protein